MNELLCWRSQHRCSWKYAGAESYPNVAAGLVDVRDVANAHILAFENPAANGRYLTVGAIVHFSEVIKILHELYPTLHLPEK